VPAFGGRSSTAIQRTFIQALTVVDWGTKGHTKMASEVVERDGGQNPAAPTMWPLRGVPDMEPSNGASP
jgi:hypothetical protein